MLLASAQDARAVAPPASLGRHARLNPWRLEPVDLRRFIRLGIEHIYTGALDPKRGYLPFVRFNLTDPPTWARHEYWGSPHMVGRFLDALAQCAEVVDAPHDDKAVQGLTKLLHNCLDNPWGLPFDTLPDPQGRKTGNMHHCREVLLALVGLARWRGCERSLELARGLVRAMEKATRETGAYPSHMLGEKAWLEPEPGWINYTTGRAIGALTAYYRATEDALAVDLAKRFADYNIEKTFRPDGELTEASGYHLHSTEGTMASILDLGALTGEQRFLAFGRKLYDVGLPRYRTSYGWAKESTNAHPGGRGEANNTGDFIEAALTLAQHVDRAYYADAERFIRNGLLASQMVHTDWIVQSEEADTDDYAYSDIRKRARGAFAFTTPNGYHSYNTDLMGGALRALCKAHRGTVTREKDNCRVNMLFAADTPWLSIDSRLPAEGRVTIRIKQPSTLWVRPLEGVAKDGVQVTVDGESRSAAWAGGELIIDSLAPGATAEVAFDLTERRAQEDARGWGTSEVHWRGNTIIAMTPAQGPIGLY